MWPSKSESGPRIKPYRLVPSRDATLTIESPSFFAHYFFSMRLHALFFILLNVFKDLFDQITINNEVCIVVSH